MDKYLQLTVGLRRIYPDYSYKIIPIVLGATGIVTDSLVRHLNEIFETEQVQKLIPKLQRKALIGSMRIMKTAMSMKT